MSMMKVKELLAEVNDSITLRKTHADKVNEYAERMSAGVTFPPIVIGHWPHSEKYGSKGIVDGLHRLGAAEIAGIDTLPIEIKKFASLPEMLAYMYEANMAHGLPVTENQRNARMKMIHKIDPKATLEALAKQFGLSKSSVDRVLKGKQGEGKSGPKAGANKSKAHQDVNPLKPKAFFSHLEKLLVTTNHKQSYADVIAYAMPETEEGPKVDKEKVKLLKETIKELQGVLSEIV